MNKKDIKPGRWVRTQWDDVGAVDGIVTHVTDTYATVFELGNSDMRNIEFDQIVAVGNFIDATNTGLNK